MGRRNFDLVSYAPVRLSNHPLSPFLKFGHKLVELEPSAELLSTGAKGTESEFVNSLS